MGVVFWAVAAIALAALAAGTRFPHVPVHGAPAAPDEDGAGTGAAERAERGP